MIRNHRRIGLRNVMLLLLGLFLLGVGCNTAFAAPGDGEMYSGETVNPDTGLQIYAMEGGTAPLDGAFYTLHDGQLYRWMPGDTEPTVYCDLPPVPAGLYYDRKDLNADVAEELSQAVTQIAGGDGALWAFNDYALRIGKIDENGVRWLPLTLDKSVVPADAEQSLRVSYCWVRDGRFECLVNQADVESGEWMALAVLSFDLDTGMGSKVSFPGALMVCPYKPGSYLAYTAAYDERQRTMVGKLLAVDGSTGEQTLLPNDIIAAEYAIGGLCYDVETDRIYYAHQGEIWCSAAGVPFESAAYLPVAAVYDNAQAWLLPGDIYAITTGGLYARNVDPQYRPQHTLRLYGVWDDEIYQRFVKAHPDVPAVIVEYNEPIAADIAQAISNGTSNVDIYAINADAGWRALVDKSYVADLSASEKLTADVDRMYPAFQAALRDDDGRLMGYPVIVYGNTWSVDEKLWERFAMGPLPTTYDQLLDYWLRWDAEFSQANPEIAFLQGGYDKFSVVHMIVTDYIRRYEQPKQPLDLTAPTLRSLLEKVERIDFGDWAERNKNGEVNDEFNEWINRPAIISQYGNRGLMSNPEETAFYAQDSEDPQQSNYINSVPVFPPVFVEGEEPVLVGQMQVLFVNPASPNMDLALAYIEGAIGAGNEVEYMAHPDLNEPREIADFEKTRKQHEAYRAEEVARLENITGPLERKDVQAAIDYYDRWLADAENNKWAVSPGAILNIRKYMPYMRFPDRSAILSYSNGGMEHLYDLLNRYTEGQLTLEGFLRELDSKLRMVVLEGQ